MVWPGAGGHGDRGAPLRSRLSSPRLTDHQPLSMGRATQANQMVKRPFWSVRRGRLEFARTAPAPLQALQASQSGQRYGICADIFTLTPDPAHLLRTQRSSLPLAALRAPGSSLFSDRLMWAKIGPVGAVVAFAILIAIVCYITQTRRK